VLRGIDMLLKMVKFSFGQLLPFGFFVNSSQFQDCYV